MGEKLDKLLHLAMTDEKIKAALLETKKSDDPMAAFCEKSREYGIDITIGELIGSGEEFCSAMLRSVNGGGTEAFDSWSDFYELFFATLQV